MSSGLTDAEAFLAFIKQKLLKQQHLSPSKQKWYFCWLWAAQRASSTPPLPLQAIPKSLGEFKNILNQTCNKQEYN